MTAGNWPEGDAATGLKEDVAAARQLLIDDLHADIGLPASDQALRQLSHLVPHAWYDLCAVDDVMLGYDGWRRMRYRLITSKLTAD